METTMSPPSTFTYSSASTAEKIAFHQQVITDFNQSICSKREQIRKIQDEIIKEQSLITKQKEKIEELKLQNQEITFINIATNEIIPIETIARNPHKSAWYYGNRTTDTDVPIQPIFSGYNNKGILKFYIETRCEEVKLCDLQVGDIIKHNFTDYWRNEKEYCKVVKITDKQVQFQPFKKVQVGYEGDPHSFNAYWFKFEPLLDTEKKPYKMNKTSSWRKVIRDNKIEKYVGEPNNMYSYHSYDGGY